ncbi:MAG: TerB family tellurite resistance protein [Muribaculaceae bacterium]|nr:TerB family tellurite resistance protein [Muribaculaceae bacterium]
MEEKYQSIELVVKLMAKTGLFFASVDGEYSQSERIFIENYINSLSQVGPVDEVKDMLENALNTRFTLDEIIADTRQLLGFFPEVEDKKAIVLSMYNFIQQVIQADGVEHPAEKDALLQWANALVA